MGSINWAEGIRIGYVLQRLPLSIGEFFKLKSINEQEALKSLSSVGMGDLLDKRVGDLSSGQL